MKGDRKLCLFADLTHAVRELSEKSNIIPLVNIILHGYRTLRGRCIMIAIILVLRHGAVEGNGRVNAIGTSALQRKLQVDRRWPITGIDVNISVSSESGRKCE